MFTHVTRDELSPMAGIPVHISHLHHYVSAYHLKKETVDDLAKDIEQALKQVEETHEPVIVDQDGEMCFHVGRGGSITLMIPWKRFKIVRE